MVKLPSSVNGMVLDGREPWQCCLSGVSDYVRVRCRTLLRVRSRIIESDEDIQDDPSRHQRK